jgi:L-rhamnose mutarotase
MTRKVHLARIKPECLEAYQDYHHNIWPELEAAYKRAGIRHISCFMKGNLLVVYAEYDVENPSFNETDNELHERWQALMRPMADPTYDGGDCEEVYNMSRSDKL